MRLSTRRPDDADVIRARLRALLAADASPGWLPGDDGPAPESPDGDADLLAQEPGRAGLPAGIGRHRAPDATVRIDPGRPGARALLLAGVAAVVLLAGWTWLDRPSVAPAPEPTESTELLRTQATHPTATHPTSLGGEAAQAPSAVVVAVVGQVSRPGLVTLPAGARVADAVEAAGGLLAEADPASVNLAAPVIDGQQVAVGVPGATGPHTPGGGAAAVAGTGPVNLNTAGPAELDGLPGIGPVLAQRIVDHRERQGAFRSVDQLADVPGIGPAILGGLVDAVTV